ncbi:hypothetical protein [Streptomyces sp. DSM 40907]|uniref:hypothetical protein n=1 Tax=Streptomyces kutzneri TaxID=3051179 RepID=UPI0028D421C6|nr:hypothetical protein [Streptomyces sp. DSM 40907]
MPDGAVERLASALHARARIEAPERLAAVLLGDQGPCGPTRWATAAAGYPINDGGYSFRNPTNCSAWSTSRLDRVGGALAPDGDRPRQGHVTIP